MSRFREGRRDGPGDPLRGGPAEGRPEGPIGDRAVASPQPIADKQSVIGHGESPRAGASEGSRGLSVDPARAGVATGRLRHRCLAPGCGAPHTGVHWTEAGHPWPYFTSERCAGCARLDPRYEALRAEPPTRVELLRIDVQVRRYVEAGLLDPAARP